MQLTFPIVPDRTVVVRVLHNRRDLGMLLGDDV